MVFTFGGNLKFSELSCCSYVENQSWVELHTLFGSLIRHGVFPSLRKKSQILNDSIHQQIQLIAAMKYSSIKRTQIRTKQ